MTQYFFDAREGDAVFIDDDGVDLADGKAADRMARLALAEMARERLRAPGDDIALGITVRDATQTVSSYEACLTFKTTRYVAATAG